MSRRHRYRPQHQRRLSKQLHQQQVRNLLMPLSRQLLLFCPYHPKPRDPYVRLYPSPQHHQPHTKMLMKC